MKLNKKYIVTGGAGFIGSHLVNYLLDNGNQIICLDDLSTGKLDNLNLDSSLKFINDKVQNIDIGKIDNDVDGIFHLAAQTSVPVSIDNFYNSSKNNISSMLAVWNIANTKKIPIVFASSSAIYGNLPIGDDSKNQHEILSPYAQDKLTMEDYASMCYDIYNTSSIGLRFFNVYGPKQDPSNQYSGVISIFINRLLNNKFVTVNGGYQTRDFVFVGDIVNVLSKSMKYLHENKKYEIFNVGTGVSITIDKLLQIISKIIKVNPTIKLKSLPPGDPAQSDGTYKKLEMELDIDTKDFVKLKDGLSTTIDFMNNEKIK